MTTEKHHGELVVDDFGRGGGGRKGAGDFVGLGGERGFAAQPIESPIFGHLDQPRGGVGGDALVGPLLERFDERFLSHIFGQGEMARAEDTGQCGNHPAEFAAEERFHDFAFHDQTPSMVKPSMVMRHP